ncbi:MAG TPA: DUF2059 domain-containing protein [Thermoanaerobaculia bacterium]|nr:DUF2059 domain-containing protein [Thermoanaerobaculia bacterium]
MLPGPALRIAVICLPLLVLVGAAPKPAPISPHEKAARELLQIVGGEDLAMGGAKATMALILQDPDMAPYKDEVRGWFQKVFSEANIESEMVKLYMDRFSEKELREIAAFFKTPSGRKAIAAMPDLMEQAVGIGMKRAQEHGYELDEMIAKAKEERESQPAATDAEAQKRTLADIRNTGTAMFSWLTDQVGAAAAGQSQTEIGDIDLDDYPVLSHDEVQSILLPQYMQTVPERDGWGHPYEYYLNVENPLAKHVMAIRSPGRDGRFSADDYTVTSFDPDELDEDIVWVDGFFVRWPQKKEN